MLLHTSVCLKLCAVRGFQVCRERFRKKIIQGRQILLFTREICKIRGEDRFYLERIDFGKKNDKRERKFR